MIFEISLILFFLPPTHLLYLLHSLCPKNILFPFLHQVPCILLVPLTFSFFCTYLLKSTPIPLYLIRSPVHTSIILPLTMSICGHLWNDYCNAVRHEIEISSSVHLHYPVWYLYWTPIQYLSSCLEKPHISSYHSTEGYFGRDYFLAAYFLLSDCELPFVTWKYS